MCIVLVCTLLNENKTALEKNLFKKADVGISLYKHKISISYLLYKCAVAKLGSKARNRI
jgi:hypothetical protein